MQKERTAPMSVRVKECYAWATPNGDISMDEFVEKMKAIGNQVMEVDLENRRVKLLHISNPDITPIEQPGVDIFICEKCGAYSIKEAVVAEHEATCLGPPGGN